MIRPASPPAEKIPSSPSTGPEGEAGTTLTSSRDTEQDREPGRCVRSAADPASTTRPSKVPAAAAARAVDLGSEPLDDVVDAGSQRTDVVGVDGGEHADAQLVAAELPVGLRVDHAVL